MALIRWFCALLFISPAAFAALSTIQCGSAVFPSTFEEGIDDYIVTLRDPKLLDGFFSVLPLPVAGTPQALEVRFPKVTQLPKLAPTCFLDARRPLLFNCPKTIPSAKARLTDTRSSTTQEISLTEFTIEASVVTRHFVDFDLDYKYPTYTWSFSAEMGGKTIRGTAEFGGPTCRTEAP